MVKYLITLVCLAGLPAASWGGDVSIGVYTEASDQPVFIKHAVFYLVPDKPVEQEPLSPASQHVVMQRGRQFSPYVSVVKTGTPIIFPNKDETAHHVYSFSPAKSFDLPLYKKQTPPAIVFDTRGVVTIGCNIHDWMEAYILVVDTRYYQIAQSHQVLFKDLPAGEYSTYFWYPGADIEGIASKRIKVNAGEAQAIRFTYPDSLRKVHQPRVPTNDYWNNY